MGIVIICFPVCDVKDFDINLRPLTMHYQKNQDIKYHQNEKKGLHWSKEKQRFWKVRVLM